MKVKNQLRRKRSPLTLLNAVNVTNFLSNYVCVYVCSSGCRDKATSEVVVVVVDEKVAKVAVAA